MSKIKKVSDETKDAIKRKSAYGLPDRPSDRGMKPEDIKRAFYGPVVDLTYSALAEIDRVVDETNTILEDVGRAIDDAKSLFEIPYDLITLERGSEGVDFIVDFIIENIEQIKSGAYFRSGNNCIMVSRVRDDNHMILLTFLSEISGYSPSTLISTLQIIKSTKGVSIAHEEFYTDDIGDDATILTASFEKGTGLVIRKCVEATSENEGKVVGVKNGRFDMLEAGSDKSLYNIGVSDYYVSNGDGTGNVSRRTGYCVIKPEDIISASTSVNSAGVYFCKTIALASDKVSRYNSIIGKSSNGFKVYHLDSNWIGNNEISIEGGGFISIGSSTQKTLEEYRAMCPIYIQYELAPAYHREDKVIENQPIRILTQEQEFYYGQEFNNDFNDLKEKALYNKASFDIYTSNGDGTGVVLRQTAVELFDGSESWNYSKDQNGRFYRTLSYPTEITTANTHLYTKINQSLVFDGIHSNKSLYIADNKIFIRYDEASGDVVAFKQWLSENPLVMQYKTTITREEKVIENQLVRERELDMSEYYKAYSSGATKDANTVVTLGIYGANATTKNLPVAKSGILKVYVYNASPQRWPQQEFVTNPDEGPIRIFRRGALTVDGSKWSDWVEFGQKSETVVENVLAHTDEEFELLGGNENGKFTVYVDVVEGGVPQHITMNDNDIWDEIYTETDYKTIELDVTVTSDKALVHVKAYNLKGAVSRTSSLLFKRQGPINIVLIESEGTSRWSVSFGGIKC